MRIVVAGLLGGLAALGCEAPSAPSLEASGPREQPLVVWGAEDVETTSAGDCGAGDGDFGASVVIAPGTLLVGAPTACDDSIEAGAVVVFDRFGEAWVESAVIRKSGGEAGARFGAVSAFDDGTLIVGAPGATGGSVDVLQRIGWYFYSMVTLAAPPGAPPAEGSSGFGAAIDVSGATIVAGAPDAAPGVAKGGAVYVYRRVDDAWGWSQIVRQQPAVADARFGRLVSIDGHILAIATATEVHLYVRDGDEAEFLARDVLPIQDARSLSLKDGVLAVVRGSDVVEFFAADDDGQWSSRTVIDPEAVGLGSMAFTTGQVVVTANVGVTSLVRQGTATDGTQGWVKDGIVTGSAGGAAAVDVADGFVVVGDGQGGVVSYRRAASNGEPCTDGLACLSGFCIDEVCCDAECGGGEVDCLACSVVAGSSADGVCQTAVLGAVCRSATGGCDRDELCNGISDTCPQDEVLPENTSCREPAGGCDLPEVCSGTSAFCPTDEFVDVGVVCRAETGECDVLEVCDGVRAACPNDGWKTAGIECRARTGLCDVREDCTGEGPACPLDGFQPFGQVCRPGEGQCDADERCSGLEKECPFDAYLDDGAACADGDACTEGDQCVTGACMPGPRACDVAPPLPDAGTDAGTAADPDGGFEEEPDAGPPDGGDDDEDTSCSCVAMGGSAAPRSAGALGGLVTLLALVAGSAPRTHRRRR